MSFGPQENAILPIQYQVLDDDGITPLDIAAATALKLICKKPNGLSVEYAATFATNGTDGIIEYQTITGDLVPSGTWQVQAGFSMPNPERTEVVTFSVLRNL